MKKEGFGYNLAIVKEKLAHHRLLERDLWRFVVFVVLLLLILVLLQVKNELVLQSPFSDEMISKQVDFMESIESSWSREYLLLGLDLEFEDLDREFPQLWEDVRPLDNFNTNRNGWLEGDENNGLVFLPKLFSDSMVVTKGDASLIIEPIGYDATRVLPTEESNILVYDEIYPNMVYLRKLRSGGIKECLVLKDGFDLPSILYRLNFQGGNIVKNKRNRIEFYNDAGEQIFEIESLKAVDQKGNLVGEVYYNLLEDDILELKFDLVGALDYPLLLDPGVVIY